MFVENSTNYSFVNPWFSSEPLALYHVHICYCFSPTSNLWSLSFQFLRKICSLTSGIFLICKIIKIYPLRRFWKDQVWFCWMTCNFKSLFKVLYTYINSYTFIHRYIWMCVLFKQKLPLNEKHGGTHLKCRYICICFCVWYVCVCCSYHTQIADEDINYICQITWSQEHPSLSLQLEEVRKD